MTIRIHPLALAAIAACALSACGGSDDAAPPVNTVPNGVRAIQSKSYDGVGEDLLTAGLG